MSKNAFLAKQEERSQWYLDTGTDRGMQSVIDYICIALNDSSLVGRVVWGKHGLRRLNAKLKELADFFEPAFTDDVDADYKQELLDRRLREIFGDELKPFHERYPYFKKINYNRGKREWRK